jgi:hypothetical protein
MQMFSLQYKTLHMHMLCLVRNAMLSRSGIIAIVHMLLSDQIASH